MWRQLSESLSRSRTNLSYQIKSVFSGEKLVDSDWETLEEILIGADVGVDATTIIVDRLQRQVKEKNVYETEALTQLLKDELAVELREVEGAPDIEELSAPTLVLVVGVNGAGKTTTIAKLANILKKRAQRVTIVAADTFRAAAIEQLRVWAERIGVDFISHERGSDPAAVVYDAVQSMRAGRVDFALVDTAGRLQTYVNLMEELKKIKRVAQREGGDKLSILTLLVMDATTGQNGISQAKLFHEALALDGIILTKVDGTAKGGIVIAVQQQLAIPVVGLGTGEKTDDLMPFSATDFAAALIE